MKGDQSGVLMDRKMQGGNVRVADKDLRVLFDQGIVDLGQDTRQPVSAANTPNRIDLLIAKCPMNVLDALRIGPREKPVNGCRVFSELCLKTEIGHVLYGLFKLFIIGSA